MTRDCSQPSSFTMQEVADAIAHERYQWQVHAVRRALQRNLDTDEVNSAIARGEIIERYPGDEPLPSALILGYNNGVPIHAVVAYDAADEMVFVVTVYIPDSDHFDEDHRTRRGPKDE